jgi:hypothetical protein
MVGAQQLSVQPSQTPVQAGQLAVSPYARVTAATDISELLTSIMPLIMLMMVMMMIMPMMKGMAEAFKAR